MILYGKAGNKLAHELKFIDKVKKEHPEWVGKKRGEPKIKYQAKRMAENVIKKFFDGIPDVRDWIRHTHKNTADTKFVETLSGRRRWLQQIMDWEERASHIADARAEALNSNRDPDQALCWCEDCKESRAGERRSVNTIVQGSAADVIQAAMIKNFNDPELSDVDMVLQVHDENGFEIPIEIEKESMAKIKFNMEHPGFDDLKVSLKCDPNSGWNWIEAK